MVRAHERAEEQVVVDAPCVAQVLAGGIEAGGEAEGGLPADRQRAAGTGLGRGGARLRRTPGRDHDRRHDGHDRSGRDQPT